MHLIVHELSKAVLHSPHWNFLLRVCFGLDRTHCWIGHTGPAALATGGLEGAPTCHTESGGFRSWAQSNVLVTMALGPELWS